MLTKLFLERFMSYNERTEIELAPLTVILGPNSSGKSSVLRALRTLRDFRNLDWDIQSSPTYARADTGFVIGAEIEEVTLSSEPGLLVGWDRDGEEVYGEDRWNSSRDVLRVEWEFVSDFRHILTVSGDEGNGGGSYLARHPFNGGDDYFVDEWEIEFGVFESVPKHEMGSLFWQVQASSGLLPEIYRKRELEGHPWPLAPLHLVRLLENWEEVAPIRESLSVQAVHEMQPGERHTMRYLISDVNRWFARLHIPYELVMSESVFAGQRFVEICLIDERTSSEVGLGDVGTGIGQVIPVVVACVRNVFDVRSLERAANWRPPLPKLLTIEQPELHLHPRLQSEMAELLADTVWTRSEGFFEDEPEIESTGVQVLVETHSEHLVLRLQSLVRRKLIPHDEISLLYVWIENGSSKVKRIHLNSRGEFLDEWPEGFFDERLQEILGWSDDI